ncbi:aminotransferase class I/II-fold pyridoxal phosphate-dependent enzyme [Neobacillus niacini]|uniref:trans-sulfuration enzyme family protein n=1 Tax=Neobacillus niacini TaxID=86668 RepID=UPI002856308B|nr:aminotransferase class I/II-fold pyridoxal phosphate-dependent enzyme [Neobacillus niacini]MDR7001779.1 cystathionine beta-lyase [Neobacillus niacini]
MELDTKLIHGGPLIDQYTGSSSVPIYQSSTFHQAQFTESQEFIYTRFGNPTRKALEETAACLEFAKYGYAFASGMAAISAVLLNFSQGDHVILCKDIYGGAYQLVTEMFPRYGIEYTFVDETDLNAWKKAIKQNTKGIYIETPSNPLLTVTDIRGVVSLAKKYNLLTIIDNTFMTPIFQNPIKLGVDIVIHSATKFINGHSDVSAGLVVTNDQEIAETLFKTQKMLGNMLPPYDCWLILRGIKTMKIRMEKEVENAAFIAKELQKHSKVKAVYYPGLEYHNGREIHFSQASSGGAVLTFDLGSYENVKDFFAHVSIPIVAVSLGGVESILSYPYTMSHAVIPEKERLELGVTVGLVRLSCGIEDKNDLLNDLFKALDHVKTDNVLQKKIL